MFIEKELRKIKYLADDEKGEEEEWIIYSIGVLIRSLPYLFHAAAQ